MSTKPTLVKSADLEGLPAGSGAVPAEAPAMAATTQGSVDKIREILFGAHMRDYDQRFSQIGERLARESTDLRTEIASRSESLECHFRGELESLANSVSSERRERTESGETLAKQLFELAQALGRKVQLLEEELARMRSELRKQILDQGSNLTGEVRRGVEEGRRDTERVFRQLQGEKLDRADFADLLAELSIRLKREFQLSGCEELSDAGQGG